MTGLLIKAVLLGVLLGLLALAALAATARRPAEGWAEDPLTATRDGRPNQFMMAPEGMGRAAPDAVSPVYDIPAERLAAAFDAVALFAPDCDRIDGEPDDLFMTYRQFTPRMGFPDFVSVRVIPLGADRSTLAVWSRSKYGYGDMGANEKRVRLWLSQLASAL